jgi:hypothetical protein
VDILAAIELCGARVDFQLGIFDAEYARARRAKEDPDRW